MANGNSTLQDMKIEFNDMSVPSDFETQSVTGQLGDLYVDDKMRRMIVDLQRHWLTDYHQSREKALVDLTEKLHEEFRIDQEKCKQDLMDQFKVELAATKAELEQKHDESLQQEINRLIEKQGKELAAAKKKQWCWQCDKEAMYHCCWNTAYCSVPCQQGHWTQHRKFCRRKKGNMGAPGPQPKPHSTMDMME
ncbi:hypothetical protein GCK72_025739 [Caenorhabditis remanei]|uniref:CRE-BRA-1 protein n=2 Tax=Caenorhabditis remanei TaxID=31234 RepID=E3ME05_CAERE|nr:hypothetical protein GCK72_025739 [Caenorhabditis remanei]EFO99457.1 CRE-BRA-1 protein [Caenorhabditis remanei]KAF1749272.1 hypothetical protein GCK72_025739 [Caenorhabditis remanei]